MALAATAEQRTAFDQSRATALDSAACLIAAFRLLGVPEALLDVGCGDGHLVKIASALRVRRCIGLDLCLAHHDVEFGRDGSVLHLIPTDLRSPVNGMAPTHDLVLCLEVAEHLPPDSADTLCDTLAGATGGTLLFSAATPGQGGSGHIHEMPHEYWRGKIIARGLRFDPETTGVLRRVWSEAAPGAWWYGQNVQVFRQTDREGRG